MPTHPASSTLDPLLAVFRQRLQHWAAEGSLSMAAEEALQLKGVPRRLSRLVNRWAAGDFRDLPPLAPLSATAMRGAYGAYARSSGTIYLNRDWLAAADIEQGIAVLAEELGHHLDALLQAGDTPGDEGASFARFLGIGGTDSSSSQQLWRTEKDQGSIWVDGVAVPVERSALVNSTPIPQATSNRTRGEWRNQYAFAALRSDGSVVTWGADDFGGDSSTVAGELNADVSQIFSSEDAFAALKSDGSVVTWGSAFGGDSSNVAGELFDVVRIFSNGWSFAALRSDGSVVTWGDLIYGGDSSAVADELSFDITDITSTYGAYAALRSDGNVVTWGKADRGGDSSTVAGDISSDVVEIFSTHAAFAALKSDGSVITWGSPGRGGDSSDVIDDLSFGVAEIFATSDAFAALKNDGSVVTWGDANYGGDSSAVASELAFGVSQIASTDSAFAALKSDGSVVSWGALSAGGDSLPVAGDLFDIIGIYANEYAFAALRNDGSIITWGEADFGGDSSAVAGELFDVSQVVASNRAFAALRSDGSVVTWGDFGFGGDSSDVAGELFDVSQIFSTGKAFAALRSDGSVVTWGDSEFGGDSSSVASDLSSDVVAFADPFADDQLSGELSEITLSATPVSVAENGAATIAYTFRRSDDTSQPLTVAFTVSGSASFGSDYSQSGAASFSATQGTITFPADADTTTLILDPIGDTTVEANETIILTLASGFGYNIAAPATATTTIRNDDTRVSLNAAPLSTPEDGSGKLLYTFTRAGVLTTPLTVTFSVGGTAAFGSDYSQIGASTFAATTGTISFAANATTAVLTLDPSADATPEANETIVLTLAAGAGYSIAAPAAATTTIVNDDIRISLSAAPLSTPEDGSGKLLYTFTRTGSLATPLTVNFSVGGTAAFGSDYSQSGATTFTTTAGTIRFAANAATAILTLDPSADATPEANETIAITLAPGAGYAMATPQAVITTLTNDDNLNPGVTVRSVSGSGITSEAGASATYSFVLNRQPTDPVTLTFVLTDSTEASLSRASITFSPATWNLPQTLTITGRDDFDNDGDTSYGVAVRVSSADPDYGPRLDGTGGVQVPTLQLINLDDTQDRDLTLNGDLNGPTNDLLQGLNGKDRLNGLLLRDRLRGGRNDDRLNGGLDDDSLFGEDGNDQLFGEQDDDYLDGGNGNDRLTGGEGIDFLSGGAGNDTYVIDDEFDTIDDRGLASDVDAVLIRANLTAFTLGAGIENASLQGSVTPATLTGNNLANALTGNFADNTINGAAGADRMDGGLGNDLYFVDNPGDVITEAASAGTDRVNSLVSFSLAANLETLALIGSAAINGTGNPTPNALLGNSASNVLDGGGGADTMSGGGGDDVYVVDNPADLISETATGGSDRINSLISIARLATNIETLQLLGTAPINGIGNPTANTLIGNGVNNVLDGGAGGRDLLTGLAGADFFRFSSRPSSFLSADADRIRDFSSSQGDRIQINRAAFGITATTASLTTVTSSTEQVTALASASLFVYNSSSGELLWNQNGTLATAGSGGVLAVLENPSTLARTDLQLL